MNELTLPGMEPERAIRDDLDRVYTPDKLARAVVSAVGPYVRCRHTRGHKMRILEPSVGGGAFVRACGERWPTSRIVGIDIDPEAPGFKGCLSHEVGDFASGVMAETVPLAELVIGNPPFSEALEHVQHAREMAPQSTLAFILPMAYLGVGEWQPILRRFPLTAVMPVVPRPWPKRIRETAVYVWTPDPGTDCVLTRALEWK